MIDPEPIIAAFGGVYEMSKATGIWSRNIDTWRRAGNIPSWWSPAIIKGAKRRNLDFSVWGLK